MFKHDKAAELIAPTKHSLIELIEKAACVRGSVDFDGDFIDIGETRLVVDGDPKVASFVVELIEWFKSNSSKVAGCIDDHVRLELLLDDDLGNTGVILPESVLDANEGENVPVRQLIDQSVAWIAENMELPAEQG